ncbi:DMT(drug/metabolite transporter) superfamily permease [Desulfitobacterium dichloroeliminans LMG P-21439]|uniref:DMT(Drug/metabolite transporter) superfamily permease n=1 Tax=Desulfitobacterium dichloroeliminans (strain LMG P-21439 / DCA1) TaxID=871963 RepID=L0F4A8_DESDL|nr:DMT family transporter [Desulfitobacterium dichloroeliminans]AGA67773.1 DMT(drug/metabolite transporter) superfamily permease [Desulfitobacterium dichloroeliminans LMG P-21439]
MINKKHSAIMAAIFAAMLFGFSAPVSKLLLVKIPPTLLAALLYLGAGLGMAIISLSKRLTGHKYREAKLDRNDLPFVLAMIGLDIAAPVFLMIGLTMSSSANVALLGNFEIVATSLIALLLFKESIGRRLWGAIVLITLASIILSVEDLGSFTFSLGSIFVLLSCLCWGFENNCTRMLSIKDPLDVVIVKGLGSGFGALLLTFILKEPLSNLSVYIMFALLLGFFAYGLSIFFYVSAQRELGAARTSTYYAIAPFIGVGLSFAIFRVPPTVSFLIALLIMIAGAYFAANEKHKHTHTHPALVHEHRHYHTDAHHNHTHNESINQEHSHVHTHDLLSHAHSHTPDIHHSHVH